MNKQGPGKIDYCDYTSNPLVGCNHGCDYCYARKIALTRWKNNPRIQCNLCKKFIPHFHEERLDEIYRLKKASKIFLNDMSDMFGAWVTPYWIDTIMATIHDNPQHTFLLLTKNPMRALSIEFPDNVWFGTTIDTQKRANSNLEIIKNIDACIKFISFEPLLEELSVNLKGIDWIIIGANSNKGAKKPPKKWADKLIKQARKKKIPIWVKNNYHYPKKIKEFPK